MKSAKKGPVLLLAVSMGVLAGCGTGYYQTADQYPPEHPPRVEAPDARSPAQYNEDASISNRVQAAVLSVPGIYAQTLQISTYEGVVTLRGTASSDASARNAVQAARQVTGVRSVDYDIQVIPQAQVVPHTHVQPQPYAHPQPYTQPPHTPAAPYYAPTAPR